MSPSSPLDTQDIQKVLQDVFQNPKSLPLGLNLGTKAIEELQPQKKKAFVSTDVDAILDKINEKGFQSLSDEEKALLEESSEQLSKRVGDQRKDK